MRNYLTFDNKDSRDFGVYINGQGTFRAPARSYNVLNIPGRNGDLLGFGSKLENVEITYRAFIYTNFKANIAALRSFLLSHVGYFKLKDSYHPDEYRLAYYKGPFIPDVVVNNGAGSFDLTFVCKPQRFLDSGDIVTTIAPGGGTTAQYSGNPATFTGAQGDLITSLSVPFSPIQDLHGYTKPWPGGGGANKLPNLRNVATNRIALGQTVEYTTLMIPLTAGTYTLSITHTSTVNWRVYERHGSTNTVLGRLTPGGGTDSFTFTVVSDTNYSFSVYDTGGVDSDAITQFWLVAGSDAGTYTPYENICPISGLTGLSAYVSPTQDPDDATAYAVDWTSEAGTVYGGTAEVVGGVLTDEWAEIPSYNGETITEPWLSSMDAYTPGATPTTGAQVVYKLATPLTYQLTAQAVTALVGQNYVWSDIGGVDVSVVTPAPQLINNPTLFDAKPLLRVYGTGTMGIGSSTITISSADVYTDIDCELMDCYKGSSNRNQYVQFSSNDFPVLKPGTTWFTFSGVTQVDITPRWYSV